MRRELIPVLAVLLGGCGASTEVDISQKARVVPKGGEVWGRDLARGLGLDTWELCKGSAPTTASPMRIASRWAA